MRDNARLVALKADEKGFLVFLLRGSKQVRTFDSFPHLTIVPPKPDLALARQLFTSIEGTFSYETARDVKNDRILALITAKINGTDAPIVTAPAALTMTSLSDALQRSLAAVTDAKAAKKLPDRAGKPVKAEATTKARRKSA
jgi:non-homologous end joining protein Ku